MEKYFFILLIVASFTACSEDTLDKTIFIPDENDSTLPAYTEWGYNSFGAQYERDYFLSSDKIVPCKILYSEGLMQFALTGTIRSNKEMTLMFIFPSPQTNSYEDLQHLHNREIDLTDDNCEVRILQDNTTIKLDVISGKLHFKRIQLLNVDEEKNRVILSGIFDLRFWQNDFPTTISKGRFDMGINDSYFFAH